MQTPTTGLDAATPAVKFPAAELARFWRKVDKNGPLPDQSLPFYEGLGPCWLWKGRTDSAGYAEVRMNGKRMGVHRASVMIHGREIPTGLFVLHACDQTNCVNPQHLWIGTAKDNTTDMLAKAREARGCRSGAKKHPDKLSRGDRHYSRKNPERLARGDANGARVHPERMTRGEAHKLAKLTELDVVQIRADYAGKVATMPTLSRKYGVSIAKIHHIIHRKAWAHVI